MGSNKSITLFHASLLLVIYMLLGCSNTRSIQEQETLPRFDSNSSPQYTTTLDSSDIIRKGDKIEVLVWEEPRFNTNTTVSNVGTITVPLIGEIPVSELTVDEFKETITEELRQYIRGEINLTVSIQNTNRMQVSVLGMVTRPDSYSIPEETSIFKILSMAGGPSDRANISEVRIYRKNMSNEYDTLDLSRYLETGEINSVQNVYPGDVVYVPKKKNHVREVTLFLRDVSLLFGLFSILNL
jgi:polysaccharide export outer membrane protein